MVFIVPISLSLDRAIEPSLDHRLSDCWFFIAHLLSNIPSLTAFPSNPHFRTSLAVQRKTGCLPSYLLSTITRLSSRRRLILFPPLVPFMHILRFAAFMDLS